MVIVILYNFPKYGAPGANFLIWAFLTKSYCTKFIAGIFRERCKSASRVSSVKTTSLLENNLHLRGLGPNIPWGMCCSFIRYLYF